MMNDFTEEEITEQLDLQYSYINAILSNNYEKTGKIEFIDEVSDDIPDDISDAPDIDPSDLEPLIYDEEPPFDYDRYRDYFTEESCPDFVLSILNDPFLPDDQKHVFVEKFYLTYLSDEDYRKHIQGYFVVFVDNNYYDIKFNHTDILSIGTYKNTKYAVPIFDYNVTNNYVTINSRLIPGGVETHYENHTPSFSAPLSIKEANITNL